MGSAIAIMTKEGRCMIAHADAWTMECAKHFSSSFHPHRRTRSAAPWEGDSADACARRGDA
jgi:hypothetical protein